jgi:hypothetical protein
MTNEQLLLMIGIPMAFNAVLFGILIAFLEAKFAALGSGSGGVGRRSGHGLRVTLGLSSADVHRIQNPRAARF